MLITEAFTWGRFRRKMWSCYSLKCTWKSCLAHWGWVTHICVSKLTIIGSDNGLPPGRRQAIIWTDAGILLIRPLGTNFGEIINRISNIFIQENAFEEVIWKMGGLCLSLNVLILQLYLLWPMNYCVMRFIVLCINVHNSSGLHDLC